VTSNRRLHRIASFTAVCVLFGITSTVSALASGTGTPDTSSTAASAPAVVSVVSGVDPTPSDTTVAKVVRPLIVTPAVRPVAARVVAPKAVATAASVTRTTQDKPAATPAAKPAAKPVAKPVAKPATPVVAAPVEAAKAVTAKPITISSYVDTPGSQAQIDKCHLVLWSHHPMWLAGHNWCGFQWMAYVPDGTTVRVRGGAAAGTYVVTGHVRLKIQGGPMLRTGADLVLQTCIGSGTGLTLLRRV
jgi:hypothetical protein